MPSPSLPTLEYPFAQLGSPVLAVCLPEILTPPAYWWEGSVGETALVISLGYPLCYQPLCSTNTQHSTMRAAMGKVNSIPASPIHYSWVPLSEYPACCFIRALLLVSMILLLPVHSPKIFLFKMYLSLPVLHFRTLSMYKLNILSQKSVSSDIE